MIYEWIVENLGYPLQDLAYRRRMIRTLRELRETQWLPKQELVERQWHLLQALLDWAYGHVPFYTERFAKLGLTPEDIHDWDDFAKLPPLTKDDIREHFDDLVADNAGEFRMFPGRTGGSTGKPTHFLRTSVSGDYVSAATFRNAEWAGWRPGMRYVNISGSHYDYSRAKQFRARLQAFLLCRKDLTAIGMSEEKVKAYFAAIHRFRPKVLWGYASAVYVLARFAQQLSVTDVSFEAVIVSSDTLFEDQRECIEQTFGCEVFDLYSSREFHIAGECEKHEGYHVAAESVYIEVVDRDNLPVVGTPGRVLVTDLRNKGFPFIRYEIGDVATRSERLCSCGRGLPLLDSVNGRIEDFIITPAGGIVSPPAFTVPLSDVINVSDYQIVQHDLRLVEVKLVCAPEFNEADLAHLKMALGDMLGEDMAIDFKFVDSIDRGVSGKRRVVVSSISPRFL